MIRINLLPQKRRSVQADESQLWLVVIMLLVLAECVAFVVFHGMKTEELDAQSRKNAQLSAQIAQAKTTVQNHDAVKAKLEKLRAREDAIAKLQSARTGPTAVLLELARLLTPGRGPSIDPDELNALRRENPLSVHNPNWDSRRLWLTSFVEEERLVTLGGFARDGEDVSELAKRLRLSNYFKDVRLMPAERQLDSNTKLELVSFQLEATARY